MEAAQCTAGLLSGILPSAHWILLDNLANASFHNQHVTRCCQMFPGDDIDPCWEPLMFSVWCNIECSACSEKLFQTFSIFYLSQPPGYPTGCYNSCLTDRQLMLKYADSLVKRHTGRQMLWDYPSWMLTPTTRLLWLQCGKVTAVPTSWRFLYWPKNLNIFWEISHTWLSATPARLEYLPSNILEMKNTDLSPGWYEDIVPQILTL